MKYVFFDSETQRFAAGNIAPQMICAVFTEVDEDSPTGWSSVVRGNHPGDGLEEAIEDMLADDEQFVVTQNGGFDYTVICSTFPRLIPLVYAKVIKGLASDTLWREKLLNLSTNGKLDNLPLPDGSTKRISYSMEALAEKYLGLDLSADKGNIEESWRANYGTLDGWPADEYPDEAHRYVVEDGEHTGQIFFAQEARKAEYDFASTETEEFQIAKSFVLYMMSAWGMQVDHEATEVMAEAVDKVMEANKDKLEESGILRGAGRFGPPFAKDTDRAADLVKAEFGTEAYLALDDDGWTPYGEWLVGQGVKMKKATGKDGSKDMKILQAHLATLYKSLGEIPEMTEGGVKEPTIKCDAEIQEYLALKCPIMAQYHERQALAKLATQMIPVLRLGDVVFPSYDAIKETGRTSSYDGGWPGKRDGQPRLYPSVNIQQIPNTIKGLDPRKCFKPRDGRVFFDVDFTGLELACVGHVTGELLGHSVHRDLYNAGVDLHGYLGGQLGLQSTPKATKEKPWLPTLARDFQSAIRDEAIGDNPMAVYEAFKLLKKHEDEDVREFFKHFRSFAKPTGLGFPGGLGPATMVDYARKTFGVTMTEEEARSCRDFWHFTYPEMKEFFKEVNANTDKYNGGGDSQYTYTSPMGMIRRGASYCAAANGWSMQTPGAEAAMMGTILVSRACYDRTQESVLFGCRPIAFVHDQIIGETTKDESLWADQCEEVARLLCEGAEMVLHSIKMRTDEALLTSVWTKDADPVRSEAGTLQVWTPQAA